MKLVIILSCLFILSSCTDIFCGKINKKQQRMLDTVNLRYNSTFEVEPIPCDYIYLKVKYKITKVDTLLLDEAHDLLYNENQKIGWQTLLIYNEEGEYIFSHSKNGNTYYQTGD